MQAIKKRQSPCATFSGTHGHQTMPANTSSAQPAKGKDRIIFIHMTVVSLTVSYFSNL